MARRPKPGEWTYTVGDVPARLTAHERADRGLAIYSRVWDGKGYQDRRALCDRIRDAAGRIVPELEVAAQKAAITRQKAVAAGVPDAPEQGPLTLAAGFVALLHGKEGKFAADSSWKQDTKRNAETIIRILSGSKLPAADVRHAHYRKLWRTLAEEHAKKGLHGLRTAEIIVGTLRSCIVWLQQEGHLEPGSGLPAPAWKQTLRAEWAQITEQPARDPAKPRLARDEHAALWAALPEADPRLALALQIGAELRLGQVIRCWRTDVLPYGEHAVGAVRVHGQGKKRGALVVLDEAQRAAVTAALETGYLRLLETAYRAGEIPDYRLFPGRRFALIDGLPTMPSARTKTGWTKTGVRKAWAELEAAAGVTHQPGRGWYGARRRAADDAEDVETDARVLNSMGGWTHTATREGYQEQGRTDVAEKARDVRTLIRPNVRRDNEMKQESEG